MRDCCGLETEQEVEIAKQIAQNSSFILLTQKKKEKDDQEWELFWANSREPSTEGIYCNGSTLSLVL